MAEFNAGSIVGSLDVDLSPFDQGLAKARAEAQEFEAERYSATVNVNVEQEGALDPVGDKHETVHVKADTAVADAKLETTKHLADEVGEEDPTVRVHADTSDAESKLTFLMALIAGIGPALIPIGAAATSVLPALATGFAGVAAGAGTVALGVHAVTGALKDVTEQQKAATAAHTADAASAKASAAAEASAAEQVINATEALKTAKRNAANQEITNAEQIRNARQSLATAERNANQANITATHAVNAAAYQRVQAIDAETRAQQALIDAREQATRELEASKDRQIDAHLSMLQSQLDLQAAQESYAATMANPLSTATEQQQAALDLARAQQAQVEATEANAHATEDNNKAQAAGVNGAAVVVSAQQALLDAKHQATVATQELTAAEREQRRTEVNGAQAVAHAQQGLADAVRNAAVSQANSAASVASAQRSLQAAYRASAQAAHNSASSSDAALDAINKKIAATSPVVIEFAHFIQDRLEPAFKGMQTAAAEGLLPGVEHMLKTLLPYMPQVDHFLHVMGRTIGELASTAGDALTDPFWRKFFSFLGGEAVDSVKGIAHIVGNLAHGFADLMEAFAPITHGIGHGIVELTEKFKDFASHSGPNSGLGKFIDYLKEHGPQVWHTVEDLAKAIGHLVKALAPIGAVDLSAVDYFAKAVDAIPVPVLTAIGAALNIIVPLWWAITKMTALAEMIGGIAIAFGAAAEGEEAAAVGMDLLLGPVGLVIAAIAVLALAAYEIYKHWSGITHFFKGLWHDVSGFFENAWSKVWGFVKKYGGYIIGFLLGGPFGLAVVAVIKHWSQITGFFKNLWGDVKDIFWTSVHWVHDKVVGGFNSVVDFIGGLGSRIANKASGMWHGITDAFRDAIDWIIRGWNGIEFKIPGFHVGPIGYGGFTLGLPDVPLLAEGGVATQATLAVIGEAGPEAVVPLDEYNTRVAPRGAGADDDMVAVLTALNAPHSPLAAAIAAQLGPHFMALIRAMAANQKHANDRYAEAVSAAFAKAQQKSTQDIIAAVRTA